MSKQRETHLPGWQNEMFESAAFIFLHSYDTDRIKHYSVYKQLYMWNGDIQ